MGRAVMLDRLDRQDARRRPSDDDLLVARARPCPGATSDGRASPLASAGSPTRAAAGAPAPRPTAPSGSPPGCRGCRAWVVDYVLVHELAHLLVPGHGPDFWALVDALPAHRAGPRLPRGRRRDRRAAGCPTTTTRRPTARCPSTAEPTAARLGPGRPGADRSSTASGGSPSAGNHATSRDSSLTTGSAPGGATATYRTSRCSPQVPNAADRRVPVQVDRAVADHPQTVDAGLLGRLAQRGRREAAVAGLAVAAELPPEAALAVQRQQDPLAGVVEHHRARGEVGRRRSCATGRRRGRADARGTPTAAAAARRRLPASR